MEDKHKCALQGGICNNTEGSYSCYCDKEEGYSGDGFNCSKLEPACPGKLVRSRTDKCLMGGARFIISLKEL